MRLSIAILVSIVASILVAVYTLRAQEVGVWTPVAPDTQSSINQHRSAVRSNTPVPNSHARIVTRPGLPQRVLPNQPASIPQNGFAKPHLLSQPRPPQQMPFVRSQSAAVQAGAFRPRMVPNTRIQRRSIQQFHRQRPMPIPQQLPQRFQSQFQTQPQVQRSVPNWSTQGPIGRQTNPQSAIPRPAASASPFTTRPIDVQGQVMQPVPVLPFASPSRPTMFGPLPSPAQRNFANPQLQFRPRRPNGLEVSSPRAIQGKPIHRVQPIPTQLPTAANGNQNINRGQIVRTQAIEATQMVVPRHMIPHGQSSFHQPVPPATNQEPVRTRVHSQPLPVQARTSIADQIANVEPNAPGAPTPSGPLPGPVAIAPVPAAPMPTVPPVATYNPYRPNPNASVPAVGTYPTFTPSAPNFVEVSDPQRVIPSSECFDCDLLENVNTYAWLQGYGGEQYGVDQDWYTQLGLFSPISFFENERAVLFFQGNAMFGEERTTGANLGLGYRQYEYGRDSIIGASIWYDVENDPERTIHQIGFGLESLSNAHEFRANGYFPVGETSHFRSTSPRFVRNNILMGVDEIALTGFDLELGAPVPGAPQLWAHAGYYFYMDREDQLGQDKINGVRGRLEYRLDQNVQFSAVFSHDPVFESSIFGMVSISFRTPGQVLSDCNPCTRRPRIDQLIYRKQPITVAEQQRFAENVITNEPIFVAQVSEQTGSPNGTGTTDNPFDSIGAAAQAAGPHGIIFVRDGSFDESFSLQTHQRLIADGFLNTNPHQVVTQLGTIPLPGQNPRSSVVMPRISSSDRAGTIKLCQDDSLVDNVEIAGFTITNSAGSSIFGIQNEGFSIHNNTLEQTPESGIALLNAAGTQFRNSTAPTSNNRISDNIIQNNQQSGVLLADLNLSSLDLTSIGVDLNAKNISLADRGPLNADVTNNTFSNNATDANPFDLSTRVQTQTNRDDHFGLSIASTTNAQMTVNVTNNTFSNNGVSSALGVVDSTGGIGLLTGGNSQITASITDNTFTNNFGVDIHGLVGNGPTTALTARLDMDIHRNSMSNAQLANTEDGLLTAGIRTVASTGILNANVGSNAIIGSSSVLSGALFDRMEAFDVLSDGNAQMNINIIDVGLNPLGRSGNEFTGWHVGVGSDVQGTGTTNLVIQNALIDAECVLKLHTGLDGVNSTTGRMTVNASDSNFIVRLAPTRPFDGIFAESLGGSQLTLNLANVTTRLEGGIPAVIPDRDWLSVRTADDGRLNLTLSNVSPTNIMTGLQDFLEFRSFDNSIVNLTINDSLIGQTQQFGIDIVGQDSSRINQVITNSSFGGNGLGLIDAEFDAGTTLVSTISNSVFQSPSVRAIRIFSESNAATETARVGTTFDGNTFQTSGQDAVQIIGNSTNGNTIVLANLINNTSDGAYLLDQMQNAPGSTLFDFFASGNTGTIQTTGTVTSSPTILNVNFP